MKCSIFCSVLRYPAIVLFVVLIASIGCSRSSGREKASETRRAAESGSRKPDKIVPPATFPDLKAGDKALLVGCTKYPELPKSAQLKGPVNDVELIRRLLVDRFGLADENIITLSESSTAVGKPTRQNVEAAFHWIEEQVRSDESFVFFFAGHGVQLPNTGDHVDGDLEPDGLDEALLPRDAERWNPTSKEIRNAIRDDELKGWLQPIVSKKVATWVIIDACHSGTVVRSQARERQRRVSHRDLGIPENLMPTGKQDSVGEQDQVGLFDSGEQIPQLAAIYAALPSEPTPEFVPKVDPEVEPEDGGDGKAYGLLTHTLSRVLTSARRPMTYESLARKIRMTYRANGRHFPTPIAEGALMSREILGRKEIPRRDEFVLSTANDGSRLSVSTGVVSGFQAGTVFEVYQSTNEETQGDGKPVAAVKIVSASFYQSEVEICEWPSVPQTPKASSLKSGQICKPVFIDFGDRLLRVAMSETPDEQGSLKENLRDTLSKIAESDSSFISIAKSSEHADWLISIDGDGAELVPAKGWISPDESGIDAPRFGPIPTDGNQETRRWLSGRFQRIAQASNLVKLSGEQTASDIDVPLRTIIYRDKDDRVGKMVDDRRAIRLKTGDLVAFEVENRGSDAVDVSMLFVDSAYGITALFPRASVLDNRITRGNKARSPRFRVKANTTGIEQVVMIAVKAEDEPISFGFLEQPSLEQLPTTLRALETPLGKLIKRIHYRDGEKRGLTIEESDSYSVQSVSWTVKP